MQLRVALEADKRGHKGLWAGFQKITCGGSWRPKHIPDAQQLIQCEAVLEPARTQSHRPQSPCRHVSCRALRVHVLMDEDCNDRSAYDLRKDPNATSAMRSAYCFSHAHPVQEAICPNAAGLGFNSTSRWFLCFSPGMQHADHMVAAVVLPAGVAQLMRHIGEHCSDQLLVRRVPGGLPPQKEQGVHLKPLAGLCCLACAMVHQPSCQRPSSCLLRPAMDGRPEGASGTPILRHSSRCAD